MLIIDWILLLIQKVIRSRLYKVTIVQLCKVWKKILKEVSIRVKLKILLCIIRNSSKWRSRMEISLPVRVVMLSYWGQGRWQLRKVPQRQSKCEFPYQIFWAIIGPTTTITPNLTPTMPTPTTSNPL